MTSYVIAIDQGTTSTRAIVFDHSGAIVSQGQLEHRQIFPQPGWVEHDPQEIWDNTRQVIGQALSIANITRHDIVAMGITNQRETAVVWDRTTGRVVYNAIVWQDTRTQAIINRVSDGEPEKLKQRTGLPMATYFSASKISWILENIEGVRRSAEMGNAVFGTIDTWLLWNLTGGPRGGVHATDVTNASRTMLMDIETLSWDQDVLELFGIPATMLPEIRSSSEVYGMIEPSSLLRGVPVAGILGDQQAATFGQAAFDAGESKNTYGTGNFLIVNTGSRIVHSANGLITTVAYRLGEEAPHYALEGSIAVTGSLVHWLRDNLGLISSTQEIESLASTVNDNGGVFFVPAFSGLFAPHWRPDARGAVLGLTRFANRGHLARAALEATAFQTRDVVNAMTADCGVQLDQIKVDGGMTSNAMLMQFQSDILGIPVIRPVVAETTALGAAYAAGLAVGFWKDLDDLRSIGKEGQRWEPTMEVSERERLMRSWSKAVSKSLEWVDTDITQ
ncbi:MAG: glycerol kinase GlpK [Rhodoglobus sp.]